MKNDLHEDLTAKILSIRKFKKTGWQEDIQSLVLSIDEDIFEEGKNIENVPFENILVAWYDQDNGQYSIARNGNIIAKFCNASECTVESVSERVSSIICFRIMGALRNRMKEKGQST